MTATFVKMTEKDFAAKYPLKSNHLDQDAIWKYGEGNGCLFETYGNELAYVHTQNPACIWTLSDGEDGNLVIRSGFHFINRLAYFISEVPVPPRMNIEVRIPFRP